MECDAEGNHEGPLRGMRTAIAILVFGVFFGLGIKFVIDNPVTSSTQSDWGIAKDHVIKVK